MKIDVAEKKCTTIIWIYFIVTFSDCILSIYCISFRILPSLQSEHCYSRAELHIIEKFNNLFKNFDLPPNKDKISRFEKIALAKKENFQPSIVTSVQCSDDDMGHNSKSLQSKYCYLLNENFFTIH